MIQRIAREGQAPAFHRVGEEHARPIGNRVGGLERPQQLVQVVPAEIAQQSRQVGIFDVAPRCVGDRRARGQSALDQPLTRCRAGHPNELLILLVRHVVDSLPQRRAASAGEGRLQAATVLRPQDVPADAFEQRLDLTDLDARDDAIEALPIQIDDPQHAAQSGAAHGLVPNGFPDVALVQLGVAHAAR